MKNNLINGLIAQKLGVNLRNDNDPWLNEYKEKKIKAMKLLKGGYEEMQTKSRYEVIAELEEKKRSLIVSKDALNDKLRNMERILRDLKRDVEDQEEEINNFKENKQRQEETFDTLIKSTEDSLKRFSELESKK